MSFGFERRASNPQMQSRISHSLRCIARAIYKFWRQMSHSNQSTQICCPICASCAHEQGCAKLDVTFRSLHSWIEFLQPKTKPRRKRIRMRKRKRKQKQKKQKPNQNTNTAVNNIQFCNRNFGAPAHKLEHANFELQVQSGSCRAQVEWRPNV